MFPSFNKPSCTLNTFLPHSNESISLYGCDSNNVRNKHFSSFPSGFRVLMGMHLKYGVPHYCRATDALITFNKSLFNLLFLPSTLTRAIKEVKLMNRDAALIGDKNFLWPHLARWHSSQLPGQLHDWERTRSWGTCESDSLGSCWIAPKSNVILPESFRTRPNTDHKVCFLDLRSSSYEVFSWRRSLLYRDLYLTQRTRSVLPVLQQVVDT